MKRIAAMLAAIALAFSPSFARAANGGYPGALVQQTQTLGALNDPATVNAPFGLLSCTVNVGAGLTGTVTFKTASDQAGTNFQPTAFTPQGGGSASSTTTTSGVYQATFSGPVNGCEAIVTAYTSGSATVTVTGSAHAGSSTSSQTVSVGATPLPVTTPAPFATPDATGYAPVHSIVGAATPTRTSVNATTSVTTCLAANANRRGDGIYNNSNGLLYLIFGTGGSTSDYTFLVPANTNWEGPSFNYTGQINCVWSAATGNAYITEVTQ